MASTNARSRKNNKHKQTIVSVTSHSMAALGVKSLFSFAFGFPPPKSLFMFSPSDRLAGSLASSEEYASHSLIPEVQAAVKGEDDGTVVTFFSE